MRGLIASITTLAVVLHLSFGCCLHLPHAATACCQALDANLREGGCDGDDCTHAASRLASPQDCRDQDPCGACRAGDPAACHDCPGCQCAATIEGEIEIVVSLAADVSWMETDVPPDITAASMRRGTGDPGPVISTQRPSLFERFLV